MNVGGAARRKTYDPAHRPRRIGLRPSKHDTDGSAAAPAARCKNCLRWGSFILNLPLPFTSFDHLVGEGEERGRHVEDERAHPAKSCRPLEFLFLVADIPNADYFARCVLDRVITGHVQLAEDVDFAIESLTFVDIHYRFSLRIQDSPKRPAVYAARHIGGYADIIITRFYEKRSRAAGLSLDLVDNREVVVHLG